MMQRMRPVDVGNPLVSLLYQVRCSRKSPVIIIHHHFVGLDEICSLIKKDKRQRCLAKLGDMIKTARLVGKTNQQPVNFAMHQILHHAHLPLILLVGLGNQHTIPLSLSLFKDATDHGRKQIMNHLGDDHANRLRTMVLETQRNGVGLVVELRSQLLHLLAHLGADIRLIFQRP